MIRDAIWRLDGRGPMQVARIEATDGTKPTIGVYVSEQRIDTVLGAFHQLQPDRPWEKVTCSPTQCEFENTLGQPLRKLPPPFSSPSSALPLILMGEGAGLGPIIYCDDLPDVGRLLVLVLYQWSRACGPLCIPFRFLVSVLRLCF